MEREQIGDCVLYCGDCRDVLPTLGPVDAVVTDPPYGVGLAYETYDDAREAYCRSVPVWCAMIQAATQGPIALSCGVANIHLWPPPAWVLAWHKPNSMRRVMTGWNTWEPVLLYGKPRGKKTSDCFTVSIVPHLDTGGHPCPKPLGWATELLDRLTQPYEVVLDPFAGSFTTGVACVQLGRRFLGIEIEPRYFDIGCRRIEEACRQLTLFPSPATRAVPRQLALEVTP